MTKIGTITLHRKNSPIGNEFYEYVSENGGYKLMVPQSPNFELVPDYIEVTIATESSWIPPAVTEALDAK